MTMTETEPHDAPAQSRGPVLAFFTFVANAYLVLFAADAVISVVEDWFFASAGPLAGIRGTVASIVVLASLVMIFVVVFVPQLPKFVFAPLIVTALWMGVGAPPIGTVGDSVALPFLSLVQLALAVAAFMIVQIRAGGWFFTAQQLPRKDHLFLRIAFASLVVVALAPVAVVAFGAWALATVAEDATAGYVKFTWTEVLARETVMRKDNKIVRLVATAHIAEGDFYRRVYASVPAKAVVLAEGISDNKELLGGDQGDNSQVAQSLGLDTQDVFEGLLEPAIVDDKTDTPEKDPMKIRTRPDVVRADIDVSELSPAALRCLKEDLQIVGSTFGDEKAPTELTCKPEDRKAFWDEILYKRNNKVLSEFDRLQAKYDVFIVPWGAMHMHDLELAFKERGFKIESMTMRTLARYRTIADKVFGRVSAFKIDGPAYRPYRVRPGFQHFRR